jgi:hypothetical protein
MSTLVGRLTGEWLLGKNTGASARPSSDEVARLAYRLYEHRGRADGHELADWLAAERTLMARRATSPVVTNPLSGRSRQ